MLDAEQIALRKRTLGSSEVATAISLNPYQTPHELWAIKRGLLEVEQNDAMRWGNKIEPLLAEMYQEDTGAQLAHFGTVIHPKYPWVSATPDRAVFGSSRLVELKCVGWRSAHHWGHGRQDVPDYYRCQVEWQMFVTGAYECDVAALIGGTDYRIYRIQRNERLAQTIFDAARTFWSRVETGEPPPVDGSDGATKMLRAMFPRSERSLLKHATAEDYELAGELRGWREALAEAETNAARVENEFRARIGDADGIAGDGWAATWRTSKDGKRPFRFIEKERKAS